MLIVTRASSERHTANDSWGDYRLVRRVVQSQANEIWEVVQQRRNQTYAMKLMMPHWAGSRHAIRSLKREYTVGRTLEHPAVIRTYTYGAEADRAVPELPPAPLRKDV